MKALCISGSPRINGNTAAILNEIAHGMQRQGFEVKQIFISEQTIGYCRGCKSCYKDGTCLINDDVRLIVEEMYDSEVVVIASPSYWGDVTAQMKVFIDRYTPYCNNNPSKSIRSNGTKGVAVAIRAGLNKKENENLVHTIEHFLGHHDIPLVSYFTVEGLDSSEDLKTRPEVLQDAFVFGYSIKI
ncbi:MAG: flavodoxin family protein [Oscillospiraceae bacterium]|jgi:multimeric flavodoxin WrbA|nr:flavodoxin family protein [Oscillospiraceae bacterium]